jgi:hypothetical protein
MHQRQRITQRPVARLALAAALAVLPTLVFALVIASGYCYPGCIIWTPDDPQWILFFCYLCPSQLARAGVAAFL